MKTVLFACIQNAGRSQMAAALFNNMADGSLARAISAGTEPAEHVHAEVERVMLELGIDLSGAKPQKLTTELARTADLLVTMGCGQACPLVPGLERDDWQVENPKGKPIEQVRQIRDEIARRVRELIASHGWLPEDDRRDR
jgi:arsenate reductase (thioredoxin)